jgi:DNA (cytosine-5)-methyltransferase 1
VDHPQESPRVLSTCTGYGGLEIGLGWAVGPLRVIAYVEREAYACQNLVAKVEAGRLPCAPIWTDLRSFDARQLRGCVDVLTGGYPCQPFSLAGKRLGDQDPRHLWPEYVRLIGECRPAWCFFENVRGHVSKGLREVRCDLERLGYRVEAGLFSAEEVGAPHRRERVYLLAADTHRELVRFQLRGRGWPHREDPALPGDDGEAQPVAHADGVRERQSERGESDQRGRSCDGGPPSQLADAHGEGLEGHGGFYGLAARDPWTGRLPVQGGWESEPGLGRLAHGVAHRVDRLRLAGNGVVPQCAEHAFRSLYQRHLKA